MIQIDEIDPLSRPQSRAFIRFPFKLYRGYPAWVPPLIADVQVTLDKKRHPFYEHSEAAFFLARRNGEVVGRVAVLVNNRYNTHHNVRQASFYYFDCKDDAETAGRLFERVFLWARARGLDRIVGPKGFGVLDGYGLLVEGFEHRQTMNMMNYNHPYYAGLLEKIGFQKEVDFVSCYIGADNFRLPDRIHRIAERVLKRRSLRVLRFQNKRSLVAWASRIGKAYNAAFVDNWEYYPLTDGEITFLVDNILLVANPKLFKIIAHEQEVAGFLFAFPDVSRAIQQSGGRLFPMGLFRILLELRRTDWVAINGAGILPEFQGRGGNAVLYSEMEKTIREFGFAHADLTQVAESAIQMRRDLQNLGVRPYKNHRVYQINLAA